MCVYVCNFETARQVNVIMAHRPSFRRLSTFVNSSFVWRIDRREEISEAKGCKGRSALHWW